MNKMCDDDYSEEQEVKDSIIKRLGGFTKSEYFNLISENKRDMMLFKQKCAEFAESCLSGSIEARTIKDIDDGIYDESPGGNYVVIGYNITLQPEKPYMVRVAPWSNLFLIPKRNKK